MSTTDPGPRSRRSEKRAVYLLMAAAFLIGLMFAIATPMWQTPDEPTHMAYIESLAMDLERPELYGPVPADIDRSLKETNFWPQLKSTVQWTGDLELVNTASAHPPLYYALCAPVFRLSASFGLRTQLFLVRLLGVFAAVAIVWLAFLTAAELFPKNRTIKLLTPALVALQPMFLFIMAGVNNDVLVNVLFAAAIYVITLVMIRGFSWQRAAALGLFCGLGVATKANFIIMIPIVLGAFVLAAVLRRDLRAGLASSLYMTVAAAVSGGWVFITDGKVLGGVVTGLSMPGGAVTSWTVFLRSETLVNYFIKKIPVQFWGDFGWLAIPMNWYIYLLTFALSFAAAAGFLVWLFKKAKSLGKHRLGALAVHAAAIAVMTLAIMRFELASGGGSQGRYLFGVIISIFLFFALGWTYLTPAGWRRYLPVAAVMGFFALNMVALFKYVIPYFYVV